MATTLMPGSGRRGSADPPAEAPAPGALRFVAVTANLLPAEIVDARWADVMRRRVLKAVGGLLALVVLLYALSWWQTTAARSSLTTQQHRTAALQGEQNQFAPLVLAQSHAATVRTQLQRLMVGDLSWERMLTTLRAQAPAGVQLTQIGGNITAGAASAAGVTDTTGGFGALNQGGQVEVGTLTLAGSASDQKAVADYADHLGRVKGLSAPFITNVTAAGSSVTFGITALITGDALGGRYAAPAITVTPSTTTPAAAATSTSGGN